MNMAFGASSSVSLRALMMAVIVLLLIIPLSMLSGLVRERSAAREMAYERVAQGWGGNITLGGPVLIIPTERTVVENEKTTVVRSEIYLLPSRSDIDVDLKVEKEPRYVGIYAVPVYLSNVRMSGEFYFSALQPLLDKPGVSYLWSESRLLLPLSQVRSLREVTQASFANLQLKLGPAGPRIYSGVEAAVDLTDLRARSSAAFEFQAVVAGSRSMSLLPLGSTTTVQMRSGWPHPSFLGGFLPVEREISPTGFQARWQVLDLNRSYRQAWLEGEVSSQALEESAFGVGVYQVVDVYQRAERSIKYALLFIALTFLTFFAWEQISRIRLHPLQYLLVGLALSMFYLLLIALSEHLAFAVAYTIAALALVLLMGVYIAGALRSSARGLAVATAMACVYGLLYVLVLSEDYALLLGAIILFVALAAVMLVTRRLDWYRLGETQA